MIIRRWSVRTQHKKTGQFLDQYENRYFFRSAMMDEYIFLSAYAMPDDEYEVVMFDRKANGKLVLDGLGVRLLR